MKKLLVLAGLIVLAFLPIAPLNLSSPHEAEAVSPSGVLGIVPPNNDFSAPPEVVTAPTNNDFEDGLTGWTIDGDSSKVTIQSSADHGDYVQIAGNANLTPKLDSSAITISSGATLTFWTYGTGVYLYTAPSPYTGWTLRWAGGVRDGTDRWSFSRA